MVVVDRCESKLVGLLTSSSTVTPEGWREFCRIRGRLLRFKRNSPDEYDRLFQKYVFSLLEFEQARSL
jgi:hypothetical protein